MWETEERILKIQTGPSWVTEIKFNPEINKNIERDIIVYAFNLSTRKAKEDGSVVPGQPSLHCEFKTT